MDSFVLSVIELVPSPDGEFAVYTSVRSREAWNEVSRTAALTCLFEEPPEPALRIRVGRVEPDETEGCRWADKCVPDPSIWIGCLPRLMRACRTLESQDVDALLEGGDWSRGVWLEVNGATGHWRRADAEEARTAFDDDCTSAHAKAFFVHASGERAAVSGWLAQLSKTSGDES